MWKWSILMPFLLLPHPFRFHFVEQILVVAIPPTEMEAVNRFHIPDYDIMILYYDVLIEPC